MSQDQERDNVQGTPSIEDRVGALSEPETPATPQEEPKEAPAPMPSADTDESNSSDDSSQLTEEQEDQEEPQLPEGVKERTKREFDKLKAQLRAERERNRQPEPLFNEFQLPETQLPSANDYAGLNQQQVNEIAHQFVTPEGEVDIDGLNRALQGADQRAQAAEQAARQANERITRYEMSREYEDAMKNYPNLDPNSKEYDPVFNELVGDKYTMEKYAKGKNISIAEAAKAVAQFYKRPETNIQKVKDEAVTEYKEAQARRAQGPVEAGRGQSRESHSDYEQLRQRSRTSGSVSDAAVAERLSKLGID